MSVKVLFVDDDAANLVVCEAACGDEFSVLTAASAEDAVSWLLKEEVGVIFADQRMPKTTGVELLERVCREYPDTVRILITAYADMPAAIDAINRGRVRRYLKKPWVPAELKAEVRDALDVYHTKKKVAALELRLRETERVYALGVVAASIGQEVRSPISWVTDNLSFVQRELRTLRPNISPEAMRSRLDAIDTTLTDTRAGVERLLEIVRSIENSSRSEVDDRELVDLADVLRLNVRLLSGELKRSASLELDVSAAPKVRGSSTKLSQVLLNLMVNALQALSSRKPAMNRISVRLAVEDGWAMVQVADNGPGIPEEDLNRVFDPFYSSKPGVGSGLGLAISRKIAEELSGTLRAGRDGKLGGTCFSLRLPVARE
jgi:signal transduction histidine kinase